MGKCIMPQIFVIGGGDEPIGDGDYRVRFIDYDGTILKEKRVDSGGSVTPPTAPNHTNIGLTFDEWTATSTNVTSDLDIRAVYYTTDGKTMLGLRSTVATGLDVVLYLNKSDGSTLTVDWGDGGANSTFTDIGNFNTSTHTYANYGDYEVKMWISSGAGTYGFGNGTFSTPVVGGNVQVLLYAFVGDSVTSMGNYVFRDCYSLTSITIPNGVTSMGNYVFQNCFSLTNIVIPNGVTDIGIGTFQFCYSLTNITIPNSVTSIDTRAFRNCCSLITYVFERTAGITAIGGTDTFEGINTSTKIYVPDALVTNYKSDTNWSTYANYIYPISEKGVTHND